MTGFPNQLLHLPFSLTGGEDPHCAAVCTLLTAPVDLTPLCEQSLCGFCVLAHLRRAMYIVY